MSRTRMSGNFPLAVDRAVELTTAEVLLPGHFHLPEDALGVVLFVHGSGSSRLSPRNRLVADRLNRSRIGTVLFDLLGEREAERRVNVFDISLLADRLILWIEWLESVPEARGLGRGLFGASTGAAAALVATAKAPGTVRAVVSRGGRPDLAGAYLARVRAPTLLIVGGHDQPVIELNRAALAQVTAQARLVVIPGASHLFEEPGALEQVADLAVDWFTQFLGRRHP